LRTTSTEHTVWRSTRVKCCSITSRVWLFVAPALELPRGAAGSFTVFLISAWRMLSHKMHHCTYHTAPRACVPTRRAPRARHRTRGKPCYVMLHGFAGSTASFDDVYKEVRSACVQCFAAVVAPCTP
jgi:hypothetical protein